ncbi:unnamed protein product [Choristocarpus tenellus]
MRMSGHRRSRSKSSPASDELLDSGWRSDSGMLRTIFHELSVLATDADGVSEKLKANIIRQRERLRKVIEEKGGKKLKSKFAEPLKRRKQEFRVKIRKVVTGDPTKRVRDHLREKRRQPPMIRFLDKAAFFVGVRELADHQREMNRCQKAMTM